MTWVCSRLHRRATSGAWRMRDGEHVPAGVRAGNWRACTCSPLTAALRSTRCCTAPLARPQAPPPSAERLPSSSLCSPARFSTISVLFLHLLWLPRVAVEQQGGDMELQGGVQGGTGGAARGSYVWVARPARARVSGGFAGAVLPAICACSALRGSGKKCVHVSGRFGPFLHACACESMLLERPKRALHVGMRAVC